MKRFAILLAALFLFSSLLLAIESEPSNIVGYVAYECFIGETGSNNFIGLPLDSGYETAMDLANAYGEQINVINNWQPATQSWEALFFDGAEWSGVDFELSAGNAYMVNVTEEFTFYSAGDLPEPVQYDLIEGTVGNNNFVMVPLDRSDLETATELGDDMGIANVVNRWAAATQSWAAVFYDGQEWSGQDYNVTIGKPLMVNITEPAVWPAD